MDGRVRIPVRFQNARDRLESPEQELETAAPRPDEGPFDGSGGSERAAQPSGDVTAEERDGGERDWHDLALRLQAEMDNYRKRQQRLAHDQIQEERQRLLAAFLDVVDNLERALNSAGDPQTLREGVQLTHRQAIQLLGKEGVEQVEALGRAFNPAWHEAVATVGHRQANAIPETVVQVLSPGYRLGDQLLRPARVIVAV